MLKMDKKTLNIFTFLLPFSAFTKELGMLNIGSINFDFISYPFFILSFVYFVFMQKVKISINDLLIFLVIFLIGYFNTYAFNLPLTLFLKQFIPIVIIYFTSKTILIIYGVESVFKRYVYFAYLAALFGLFQFVLKIFGILILTPFHALFLDSVALEPSHYVAMTLPAFVYWIEKKEYNNQFKVILLSLILTFKITAFVSIGVYFIFKNFDKVKYLIVALPIVVIVLYFIIINNINFSDRIFGMISYFETQDVRSVENGTVFSFATNFELALHNLKETYGLGIGFGGHETMYNYYFDTSSWGDLYYIGLNMKSAHSLLVRVISELGIIGLMIYYRIFKGSLSIKNMQYQMIAMAAVTHFISKAIKLGGYFDYGTLFFLTVSIVAIQMDKKLIRLKNKS